MARAVKLTARDVGQLLVAAGSEFDDRVDMRGGFSGKRTTAAAAAQAAQAAAASQAALLPKLTAKERREQAARAREEDELEGMDDGLQRKKQKRGKKERQLDAEAEDFFQQAVAAAATKKQQRTEQFKCACACVVLCYVVLLRCVLGLADTSKRVFGCVCARRWALTLRVCGVLLVGVLGTWRLQTTAATRWSTTRLSSLVGRSRSRPAMTV